MTASQFSQSLPADLYDAAGCRALDQRAIAAGTGGYELMQRAAEASWALLQHRWPAAQRVLLLCGAGNNGGDGYVLARLAAAAGHKVTVIALADPEKLDGDARGGAALSVREITGKPIKFIGVGEKSDALEPFYPDRVATRILGMGDLLSLIEEVERKVT